MHVFHIFYCYTEWNLFFSLFFRHLQTSLADIAIHGYQVFHVDKPTPTGRECGSIMYVNESHQLLALAKLFVDINPKNAVHQKLVLIYRIQEYQQLMMMMSSIQCSKELCYHNMNASSLVIWFFQTLIRYCRDQLPHPATNWCNYLKIITSSHNMCMKPPGRTIYWT